MVCNNHILIVNYIYYNHVVAPYVTIQLEVHIYIYIEEYLCFRHFCVWGISPLPPPPDGHNRKIILAFWPKD